MSAISVGAAGVAVVAVLAVTISAIGSHRLPAFTLAVLPLIAMGTFEVVTPAADAVSRLSHHVAASRRLLEIADLPLPVHDPSAPPLPQAGSASLSTMPSFVMELTTPGRWTDTTRRLVGWMAQDTHLFNTTLGANIALARPGADDSEIAAAARTAQLGPRIDALPRGLDTPVGEQGAQLSGGQRQRVALARALLAKAPLLVLDEPTSGLDGPTAQRLVHDVLATTPGTTILYITHRSDELGPFDDVIVVDQGKARRHGNSTEEAPATTSPSRGNSP